MMKTIFLHPIATLCTLLMLTTASLAQAQLRVEISGVGANQIPIAIAAFANETIAPQQVTAVIKADLMRSGYFKIIDTGGVIAETADVNYADWKGRGADALVIGSVQQLADGRFDVRYRLLDTVKSTQLSALAMATTPQYLRLSAHKIADDIYEKLIGVRGAFATRIAYVSKIGNAYQLEIADSDGEGRQVALRSNEPIISPAWSPDGTRVAYVSFEAKKPVVYVQNLVTRQRFVVANYKGSNSAPSWSPDGSRLAVALSRDGLTQVYTVGADGSNLKRLSSSNGIDTGDATDGEDHLIPSVRFTALSAGQAFAFASQEWAHLIPETVVWCRIAGYPVVRRTWAVWPAECRNRDVAHLIIAFEECPDRSGSAGFFTT